MGEKRNVNRILVKKNQKERDHCFFIDNYLYGYFVDWIANKLGY
jgi:hypothetical protein